MNARGFVQRHRALRWVAPIGVAGVAALAASGMFTAHAVSRHLPRTSPTSLLAQVQTSNVDGFSGTVVSHLALGLPQLPDIGRTDDGTSVASLLTGSHTMQVWYGGVTKQRIALLGATDETDLFRDGRQLWEWNSAHRSAVHVVLPEDAAPTTAGTASVSPQAQSTLTPDQLAKRLLDELDPNTRVQVNRHDTVADRSAYDLVLTPRSATRIGSVHVAVDGATKMPLAVQIFAKGADKPAVDVAFTSIDYSTPAQRNFTFKPPPDAHVRTVRHAHHSSVHASGRGTSHAGAAGLGVRPRVIGTGWSRVLEVKVAASAARKLQDTEALQALTPVSGSWGSGRLLDSSLVTALITKDGRIFVGAVEPSVLYAAAATK